MGQVKLLRGVAADLLQAWRSLARTRSVTTMVVLLLALALGAAVGVFSVVNGLLLRPLPVTRPAELALMTSGPMQRDVWTYAIWNQMRQRSTLFGGTLGWANAGRMSIVSGGRAAQGDALFASGEFFQVLGVPPLLGRTFESADDPAATGPRPAIGPDGPVAVISEPFWRRHFGGGFDAIGSIMVVEGVPFTIIGVTPARFFGLEVGRRFDIALPLGAEPLLRGTNSLIDDPLVTHWLHVMVRRRPGQSVASAERAVREVQPDIREAAMPSQFPERRDAFLGDPLQLSTAATGTSNLRAVYMRPLFLLFALMLMLLAVACADVAALVSTRAEARRHELAVRSALGASGWRLARQALLEGVMLAGFGGGLGLLFAGWIGHVLVAQAAEGAMLTLPLDWRVAGFATAVALVSVLIFATAPAIAAARIAPAGALKDSRLSGVATSGSTRGTAIVIQVALSTVLVVGAALLGRTLLHLAHAPLGFDPRGITVLSVDAEHAGVAPGGRVSLYARLVDELAGRSDLAGAAGSIATPIGDEPFFDVLVDRPGTPPAASADMRMSKVNFVTPGWFATYGVPLRAGRDFNARDRVGSDPVVIVNDAFIRKFSPSASPVGRRFIVAAGGGALPMGERTVVGVVGGTVANSLRTGMPPIVYVPLEQWTFPVPLFARFLISVRLPSPDAHVDPLRSALMRIDPGLRVNGDRVTDQVDGSLRQERLLARFSGGLALLALALAAFGLYAVTAYSVRRRESELGLRIALGAQPGDTVKLVVGRSLRLTLIGVLAGLIGAGFATRMFGALLFGVSHTDPLTFIAVPLIFLSVAGLAAWLPARRALRIDPARVLRTIER